MGKWRTAQEALEGSMGKLDSAIDAMPEDIREHWSTRPQYIDYGIDAAEREIDTASDKLSDVEQRLLEMPAPDLWAVEYKVKILAHYAGRDQTETDCELCDARFVDFVADRILADLKNLTSNRVQILAA
jgi:hypothetical protein